MSDETLSRERILDVAEEVFRRYGPARATVVDGARALGVSHGARLYDWLWTVMKSKRELAAGDPELFALYMALRTESREVVCEHLRELRQQIAQILADGLTSGEFVGLDPEATAEAILVATTRFHNPVHAQEWSDSQIDRSFERVWYLIKDGLYVARFLDTLIEEAAIPTPLNLVVADFGATYGLSWAVTSPQKVRRLAIVGGSNFSSRYRWHGAARLLRIPLLGEVAMATVTLSSHQKMMRHHAALLSPEYVRESYALSLAKPQTRRMLLKLYRSVNPKDFLEREDRLHHLRAHVPTLVLWGDKDPFITPEYADQFGSAHMEHFPHNGHWLAVESPEIVAQRLAPFFA